MLTAVVIVMFTIGSRPWAIRIWEAGFFQTTLPNRKFHVLSNFGAATMTTEASQRVLAITVYPLSDEICCSSLLHCVRHASKPLGMTKNQSRPNPKF